MIFKHRKYKHTDYMYNRIKELDQQIIGVAKMYTKRPAVNHFERLKLYCDLRVKYVRRYNLIMR